jgi:phosphate transport system permease protein
MSQTVTTIHMVEQTRPRLRYWSSIMREKSWWPGADAWLSIVVHSAAVLILGMLASLLVVMVPAARMSFKEFGWSFLIRSDWRPNEIERPKRGPDGKVLMEDGQVVMETLPPQFGALPVIYGTAASSMLALLFAVPVSLGCALFLVRIAPSLKLAAPISFLIEFLAAIPSIAYGIWGLFVLAPFLQNTIEPAAQHTLGHVPGLGWLFTETSRIGSNMVTRTMPLTGRDLLCGGLVLSIMILPIITAVSRDVLRAVPREQIEGTLALGATWWQSCKQMLRYGRAGLFGAIMLGLARAAGETMAVAMVIGNNNRISASPFSPAQTMSSLLANEFAEASGPMHLSALVQVALILLVMSLVFNVVARYLVVGKSKTLA